MSIIQGTAKSGGTVAASFYDYPIGDSLRFDGSSYLTRTPSTAGNQKTWTWSGWVKRGKLDGIYYLFGADTQYIRFNDDPPNNTIRYVIGGAQGITSQVFRDLSSWYHIVLSVDTTQATDTNRIKLYVNGSEITAYDSRNSPAQNTNTPFNNNNVSHTLGTYASTPESYFNGYLANIQFIDGQALDPYFFGEFKDDIWVPYNAFSTAGSGTATASDGDTATDSYGTNGFHLTFEDGIESLPVDGYTGNQNAFRDKSHNTNHWKIN